MRLKADGRLARRRPFLRGAFLLQAKLVNRRDERTLARLAAIHHLARKTEAFDAVVKEVESFCSHSGLFCKVVRILSARKQYAKAEECFKKAAELRPDLSSPRAGFGLLLMQLGREPEAKVQLESAFKTDPFHVRVSNALKVLKHLDGCQQPKRHTSLIKYDTKIDKIQAAFLADYLEELHTPSSPALAPALRREKLWLK